MLDKLVTLFVLLIFPETGEDIQTKEMYTTGIHYFDELEGTSTVTRSKSYDVCNTPIFPQHQITRRVVEEKHRAIYAQKFYLDLLNRYLTSKVGPVHSRSLMKSYCDVLNKLKDMRQIILAKSLQV